MYTLEDVTKLIPYKFHVFDWNRSTNTNWVSRMQRREGRVTEQVLSTITHSATRSVPCLQCGLNTRGMLRKVVHPILQPVVDMNPPSPAFCCVECVRKYVVANQLELLLFMTC